VDARPGRRVAAARRRGRGVRDGAGGPPSLSIGKLLETRHHDIDQILREALEHETQGLACYRALLEITRDASISLEEYARKMIASEEMHVSEVEKMLRRVD